MDQRARDGLFVGIDIGTSGVRALALDADGHVHGQATCSMKRPTRVGSAVTQEPEIWRGSTRAALTQLLGRIPPAAVRSIAVDGTSGTILLADATGMPLTTALMYNDSSAASEARMIGGVARPFVAMHGPSSPLARLLHLQAACPQARHVLHQADWIAGWMSGRFGYSDENNSLKLGYDPVARCWPDWLASVGARRDLLPQVLAPGRPLGKIDPQVAEPFGLSTEVLIVAGTTDGVASFLAAGAREIGEAVTSLGSTLVVKVLSPAPLFAPEYGVYSHRIGDLWLVGGASNTGGDALLRFFTEDAIRDLTSQLDPERMTGLDYYPLPSAGERFPINDPQLPSRTTPRPPEDAEFFQGLLEGIARVEQLAYQRIASLGAPYPTSVRTVGRGAANHPWTRIRARLLGVPLVETLYGEAAYGAAMLAREGALSG